MFPSRSFRLIKRSLCRDFATKDNFIDVSLDREGVALISLQRQPVNTLNLTLLQELNSTINDLKNDRCKGLVITSAARVFSAGIDLTEFNNPEVERLRMFCSTIQDLFFKLYATTETTSAVALNGYTAAGGCVIALLCDYRVMVTGAKAKIGFNDSVVGIVPRPWLCELMNRAMGHRQAEIALTASTMYSAEEAVKVNLIDETASDKEDAIEKCKQFIREYNKIPTPVRARMKRHLRQNIIDMVQKNREQDIKLFTKEILDPYVQERIRIFTEQMKSKK